MRNNNPGAKVKLVRSAKEIKKYRVLMKLLPTIAACLTMLIVITYVCSAMYNKFGSFTVTVNKFDNVNYALTLCETPDFLSPIARLNSKAAESITNITATDIPADVDMINGEHNGDNYVAYTFYLKNAGEQIVDYEYMIYIINMSYNIEHAVRVRLYVDHDYTNPENGREYIDYARTASDGSGPEPGTVSFKTNGTIVREQVNNFKPGDITKFTVVIWLEGNDPDCIDDVIGGEFKIDMSMTIINTEDDE